MIQDRLSPSLLDTWATSHLVRDIKEQELNMTEDSWVTLLLKSQVHLIKNESWYSDEFTVTANIESLGRCLLQPLSGEQGPVLCLW